MKPIKLFMFQQHLPSICGTMSGEHVYFDASDSCNNVLFNLGPTAMGVTAIATRSFRLVHVLLSRFYPDFIQILSKFLS
jgi:hypothetical protein